MQEEKKKINTYHKIAIILALIALILSLLILHIRFTTAGNHFHVKTHIAIANLEQKKETQMDFTYTISNEEGYNLLNEEATVDIIDIAVQQENSESHIAIVERNLYIPEDASFGRYHLTMQVAYLENKKEEVFTLAIFPRIIYLVFTPQFLWIVLGLSLLCTILGIAKTRNREKNQHNNPQVKQKGVPVKNSPAS